MKTVYPPQTKFAGGIMRSFKESKFHILDDLKAHHHNFALFSLSVYMIEMLLADLNMQLKIDINQSLI